MEMETVQLVEYRVIRPDGTLVYHVIEPTYERQPATFRAQGRDQMLLLGTDTDAWVAPPWRVEGRVTGEEQWTFISESGEPTYGVACAGQ